MLKKVAFYLAGIFFAGQLLAAGMQPESPIVLIEEKDGIGQMVLQNTESEPLLLITTLVHMPEDPTLDVVALPAVIRVEPGDKQIVRFALAEKQPLKTQRIMRVQFEGVPRKLDDPSGKVVFTIRHDMPLIVTPKGLAFNPRPWEALTWELKDRKLTVRNPTDYVIRLSQQIGLNGAEAYVNLDKSYMLANETAALELPADFKLKLASVRIFPSGSYGYTSKAEIDFPIIH